MMRLQSASGRAVPRRAARYAASRPWPSEAPAAPRAAARWRRAAWSPGAPGRPAVLGGWGGHEVECRLCVRTSNMLFTIVYVSCICMIELFVVIVMVITIVVVHAYDMSMTSVQPPCVFSVSCNRLPIRCMVSRNAGSGRFLEGPPKTSREEHPFGLPMHGGRARGLQRTANIRKNPGIEPAGATNKFCQRVFNKFPMGSGSAWVLGRLPSGRRAAFLTALRRDSEHGSLTPADYFARFPGWGGCLSSIEKHPCQYSHYC